MHFITTVVVHLPRIEEDTYPWNLPKEQISLTKERIKEIILKYVSILTEKQIEIGYYDPENGG